MLLGDVLRDVRLRHPVYADPSHIPTISLVAEATRYQRVLAEAGTKAYSGLLAAQVPIYFALDTNNLPGTVAAGTTGGLPVDDPISGDPSDGTAGYAPHYDLENAQEILAPFVATSVAVGASTTVVTLTGAGRTINADVIYYLQAVDGPGFGPDAFRAVISNTATAWTIGNLRVSPMNKTVWRLIAVSSASIDTDATVVTQLPSTRQRAAYLVKLNAQGQPYIDLTTPLIGTIREGVPLPPHYMLLKLECPRTAPGSIPPDPSVLPLTRQDPFVNIPILHGSRRDAVGPAAFVEGERMYLSGDARTWGSAQNLLLTFVPIPPAFDDQSRTVGEEAFLLPDSAAEAMATGLAYRAAMMAYARKQVDYQTVIDAKTDAAAAKLAWLRGLQGRVASLRQIAVRLR